MISLILTAFGIDQPGLISSLSGIVGNCDGNIEESRMLRMGDDFVMVVLITLPNNQKQKLDAEINRNTNLVIHLHETTVSDDDSSKIVKSLTLTGADNEGIVHSLTKYLAGVQVNISTLESYISNAPVSGTPLFNLRCSLEIPQAANLGNLNDGLQELGRKLGVNIDVPD